MEFVHPPPDLSFSLFQANTQKINKAYPIERGKNKTKQKQKPSPNQNKKKQTFYKTYFCAGKLLQSMRLSWSAADISISSHWIKLTLSLPVGIHCTQILV